jgi:hypothetical protein
MAPTWYAAERILSSWKIWRREVDTTFSVIHVAKSGEMATDFV